LLENRLVGARIWLQVGIINNFDNPDSEKILEQAEPRCGAQIVVLL
jgi:hypothetical protein